MAVYASTLLLFGAIWRWRTLRVSDALLLVGLLYMACTSVRRVIWYGIVAAPILVQLIPLPVPRSEDRVVARSRGRSVARGRTVGIVAQGGGLAPSRALLVGLLAIPVILVQPWFKPLLPLPESYRAQFADIPGAPLLASNDTPFAAVQHLRQRPCEGHLFNELGAGSYLDWALYPQTQVFIDPRVDMYPFELWGDYLAIGRGENAIALLDQKYGVKCALLNANHQAGLLTTFQANANWVRTYPPSNATATDSNQVWRRR